MCIHSRCTDADNLLGSLLQLFCPNPRFIVESPVVLGRHGVHVLALQHSDSIQVRLHGSQRVVQGEDVPE